MNAIVPTMEGKRTKRIQLLALVCDCAKDTLATDKEAKVSRHSLVQF